MNVYKQGDKLNNSCIEKMLQQGKSVSHIQKTACKLKSCSEKDKKSFLQDKISSMELREKAINTNWVNMSFDDIYSSMKDTTEVKEVDLSDTAKLFNFAVSSLEDNIEMIFSDNYIVTFNENNQEAKEVIANCCNRLDRISKVVTSLLA